MTTENIVLTIYLVPIVVAMMCRFCYWMFISTDDWNAKDSYDMQAVYFLVVIWPLTICVLIVFLPIMHFIMWCEYYRAKRIAKRKQNDTPSHI